MPIALWIWRRCLARRASASVVSLGPTPFGLSAVGLKKGDAAMPINSPLVKAIDGNLRGKAFRFGIFRGKILDLEVPFSPCLDEEIGRLCARAACRRHSRLPTSSNADESRFISKAGCI